MEWFDKYIVKGFFGWENFKWMCRNIMATFSNEPSKFARKRIESFWLFTSAWSALTIFTFVRIWSGAHFEEILALTGAMFVYAGYTTTVIQKEKREIIKNELDKTKLENEPK